MIEYTSIESEKNHAKKSSKFKKIYNLIAGDLRFHFFILASIALTLIVIFSMISPKYNDVLIKVNVILPQNSSYDNNDEEIDQLYANEDKKERPPEGYVVDMDLINEHCEPTNYDELQLQKYPMQDCLDYLDKKQSEYLVKPISPKYCNESEPMLFHVYWRGNISEKLSLFIKSFLYTQPLKCSLLNVWIDGLNEDIQLNQFILPFFQLFEKNIVFKRWITEEQLNSDPIFNGWQQLLINRQVVGFSDIVRFVLLHKYGGMYFDVDTIILQDMSPFYNLDIDFAYRWAVWDHYNTAILRLRQNSTVGKSIIKAAMKNKINFHPMAIKAYLVDKPLKFITKDDLNEHLYMMPVLIFDPLWLKSDLRYKAISLKPNLYRWKDAFSSSLVENEFPKSMIDNSINPLELRNKNNFFRGAFTYHWHNQWKRKIPSSSWLGVMQSAYDAFIEGRDSNLYNEYL